MFSPPPREAMGSVYKPKLVVDYHCCVWYVALEYPKHLPMIDTSRQRVAYNVVAPTVRRRSIAIAAPMPPCDVSELCVCAFVAVDSMAQLCMHCLACNLPVRQKRLYSVRVVNCTSLFAFAVDLLMTVMTLMILPASSPSTLKDRHRHRRHRRHLLILIGATRRNLQPA